MRSIFGGILSGAALVAVSVGASATGHAAEQAALTSRTAATQKVDFDVFLPVEHRADLETLLKAQQDPKSPQFHQWLKPAEFNARFGVSADKLSAIKSELTSRGLAVSTVAPRQLHVSGPAKSVEETFSSELKNGVYPSGKATVAFARPFAMPTSIAAADGVVAGLSGKIRMQVDSHQVTADVKAAETPANRRSPVGGYWFTDLKQAYRFPSYQAYSGKGVTIGVLMSGDFLPADMTAYFGHEKIAPPAMFSFPINGGAPFGTGDSVETALDLQQTGGMAPNSEIVLFNLPDLSDANIIAGLVTVVEDNFVDVLSMSFGGPEKFYAAEYNDGQDYTGILQVFDDLFAQGNAEGISFVASSGDYGAKPIPAVACFASDAKPGCGTMQLSVSIPASSPHVTGVGGTNLVTSYVSGSLASSYVAENAYDDPVTSDPYGTPASGAVWGSGGGDSIYFAKPPFQNVVSPGGTVRTVPDVSLQMGGCPYGSVLPCGPDRSYVYAYWNKELIGLVGTSVSAPDFAGLLALKIERERSRQGNANYLLYLEAAEQTLGIRQYTFREGVPGYNGYYATTPGYDRVLGIGTVKGLDFLRAPADTPVASIPQTPSNP